MAAKEEGREPARERWREVYREQPELFDAFARAQDPEEAAGRRLLTLAGIAGRRVLEIGSGTGRTTELLTRSARHVVAVEPRESMARVARKDARATRIRARGQALPLRAESVERVVASWVLADLGAPSRAAVLAEAERVLDASPGAGIWLLENAGSGEFPALRGREGDPGAEVRPLVEEHRFEVVEVVATELRFRSSARAEEVLGTILGERARERLQRRPRARIGLDIAILYRPARG